MHRSLGRGTERGRKAPIAREMLRRALPILLASLCALALTPLGVAAPSQAERTAARTIVVRFAPSTSPAARARLLSQAGARPVRTLQRVGFVVARVAPSRRAAALALLRRAPEIADAQGSHVFNALDTVPADPGYAAMSWPWQQLGLTRAWDFGTGSPSVV